MSENETCWGVRLFGVMGFPMQVTLDTFSDEIEAMKWVDDKVSSVADPTKPARIHPQNWLLSEFWFSVDKGVEYERSTKLSDEVERNARDATSSAHALDLHHHQPLPPAQPQDAVRHRSAVQKVVQMCNKLGKTIVACEGSLPARKRKCDEIAFQNLKSGLTRCRECKESTMDELEDMKTITDDMNVGDTIENLKGMAKVVGDHLQALQEAMQKSQVDPAPVKAEAEAPQASQEAEQTAPDAS